MPETVAAKAHSLRIGAEELRHRMDGGEPATFLDTRAQAAWGDGQDKIRGATRADPSQALTIPPWGKDQLIVAYCT